MSKARESLTEEDILVACNSLVDHMIARAMRALLSGALPKMPDPETDNCAKCGCVIVYDPTMRARITAKYPGQRIVSLCMECAAPQMAGRTDEELTAAREMARPSVGDLVDRVTNERLRAEFQRYMKD